MRTNHFPFPELEEFITHYNKIVMQVHSKTIFVRGIEIQESYSPIIDTLLDEIHKQKTIAIDEKNNTKANLILCFELCASALKNELNLLINLKNDKPDLAWQSLIYAQKEISLAIRNHPFDGTLLENYAHKLYTYEKLLFPKMKFVSRECIVSQSKCSICKNFISQCEHISGYAYMGEICVEIVGKLISLEGIALVDSPDDKSCRVLSFSENNKSFDVFTHREIIKQA